MYNTTKSSHRIIKIIQIIINYFSIFDPDEKIIKYVIFTGIFLIIPLGSTFTLRVRVRL